MTDIRATSVNDSLNCLKLDLQPHNHTPINLSKVVYFRHIFCQYQHFTSADGMSRPEKFWPKRKNLQTHCRRNSRKRMYLFMKASRVVLRGVRLREEPLTWYVMRNSLKYGQFTALNIPKCEHFTHLVCPLRFLVISAIRRLGNVQSFKTCVSLLSFLLWKRPRLCGLPHLRTFKYLSYKLRQACNWTDISLPERQKLSFLQLGDSKILKRLRIILKIAGGTLWKLSWPVLWTDQALTDFGGFEIFVRMQQTKRKFFMTKFVLWFGRDNFSLVR